MKSVLSVLDIDPGLVAQNGNSREQMEKIKEECLRNLSKLPAAPSAGISERPPCVVVSLVED